MSVGESAKKHPAISITLGIILVGAAIAVAWWQRSDGPATSSAPRGVPLAWFTVDDGKTWFADAASKLPPIERDGKKAYRCYVFHDGTTEFVAYLERYPDAVKARLESMAGKVAIEMTSEIRMLEVKPAGTGDHGWVDAESPAGQNAMLPKPPSGKSDALRVVWPHR